MRLRPRSVPSVLGASILMAVALGMTGCTPWPQDTTPTSAATGAPAPVDVEGPAAPPAPTLIPEGAAIDNQPFFASVVAQVWGTEQRTQGRAYIDALAAAGFDRAAMQVTHDSSTVGNAAESIQFSVRWHDGQCLVGQVGPSTGDPVTQVVPALAEGRCLIGNTRPIDW